METEKPQQMGASGQNPPKRGSVPVYAVLVVCVLATMGLLAFAGVQAVEAHREYELNLTLTGEEKIVLEYGTEYVDPGAEGTVCGLQAMAQPQELEVIHSGQVDTSRVGSYQLRYRISYGRYTKMVVRTVEIVDTQKPSISLVANPETYTLPGAAYEEEGFYAYDDYDGDLTDKVVREEKDGVVTYSVADSSGNITEVSRTIVYDDPVAPEIVLEGDRVIYLYVGSPFAEPGFSAVDNCDGDITDRVAVTGSVDCSTQGTYMLTYTVHDAYGNEASATRTIQILARPAPVQPVGGVIYLTFDDGPGPYTQKLLDVLAKYDVKATFFVVKTGRLDMLSKIVDGGHSIGIHSLSHRYEEIYASEAAYLADLYGMQEIIREYTGVTTYLMRFPGGSSNKVSSFNPGIMTRLTKLVEEEGFRYFDWNVSSGDAGGALTADQVYQNVINGCATKKCSIVLQHDIWGYSVDAVERIIQWGLENGYTFAALGMDSPCVHHGINN
ncbi:MAG: immunoglobulin-like domain-containing protein [Faecousia sp.]